MENVYTDTLERVRNGDSFQVDFKKRTLKINNRQVTIEGELGIKEYDDLDEWLDEVEELYDTYKYSKPTKRTMERAHRSKFRALTVSELIDECGHGALNAPIDRDEAQAALELFILLSLVNGSFNPEELFAKDWFFQGRDKSLIIRKDWF